MTSYLVKFHIHSIHTIDNNITSILNANEVVRGRISNNS